jgi:hypothetical protein
MIRRLQILFGFLLLLTLGSLVFADDYKESALSWQKQAVNTRKTVIGVMDELNKIGDKGNPDAKGLIADAQNWLQEADKNASQADKEMKENSFEKASYGYNMAWQYYVKSATAALNARRILTGQ